MYIQSSCNLTHSINLLRGCTSTIASFKDLTINLKISFSASVYRDPLATPPGELSMVYYI